MAAGTHYLSGLTPTNEAPVQKSDDAEGFYVLGE